MLFYTVHCALSWPRSSSCGSADVPTDGGRCLCSCSCCPTYLKSLLTRLLRTSEGQLSRSACAAYIASFLARSSFISDRLVVQVLQHLAAACTDYARSASMNGSCTSNVQEAPIFISQQAGQAAQSEEISMTERHQVRPAAAPCAQLIID